MAAAEGRTAWQRAANRCFVQEDAKRAPKLACCPSSTQQYDSSNGNATDEHDHCVSNFIPLNWNFMHSNLPPDMKWWLQLEPTFSHQKNSMSEQLEAFSNEVGEFAESTNDAHFNEEEMHCGSVNTVKPALQCDSEAQIQEMKTVISSISQQVLKQSCLNEAFMDLKPMDRLISKETGKASLDMDKPWEVANKCEPWWRISDKEELASLVAQKSLQNIENCDLPRPTHINRNPFTCLDSMDDDKISPSSIGCNFHDGICRSIDYLRHGSKFKEDRKYWYNGHADHYCDDWCSNSPTTDPSESHPNSELDPSRSQLLEALRRSQTRARKAEMAARKAYSEKEHIVKILFKQASHLFAYKQWLQILQLESLCLQLKIKDHHLSSLLPVLPWMPLKGKPVTKNKDGGRRKGKKPKKCSLCKYAFYLAVGLGLTGAGLLLGCCLGWLLPML
ncbi:hypothetical protein AXF42_Ash011088 [Apostasia shenzhenica]|uniref:Uncharacterized protein n=1 Tax=Apostasia shenzhenica TaxID=1088818 RepID=A0A2H9ZR38_9ASPA|nr:hypothetical protein AXF42_Ash011088 [Apostasia shenzhenica]